LYAIFKKYYRYLPEKKTENNINPSQIIK